MISFRKCILFVVKQSASSFLSSHRLRVHDVAIPRATQTLYILSCNQNHSAAQNPDANNHSINRVQLGLGVSAVSKFFALSPRVRVWIYFCVQKTIWHRCSVTLSKYNHSHTKHPARRMLCIVHKTNDENSCVFSVWCQIERKFLGMAFVVCIVYAHHIQRHNTHHIPSGYRKPLAHNFKHTKRLKCITQ